MTVTELRPTTDTTIVTLAANKLRSVLKNALLFAGKDQTRPVLCAAQLEVEDGALLTEATVNAISNYDDVIDSRDVIARITELEEIVKRPSDDDHFNYFGRPHAEDELKTLLTLAEQGANACPDWEYGKTLVRDSYFEDYARELAEDIGAIDSEIGWPSCHIDWPAAADSLRTDYTSIDFDGVTYWAR